MNKRIKKLWIRALRSGKYNQTTGRLKRGTDDLAAYCCLGVLCEIAVSKGVIQVYDATFGTLPTAVTEWAQVEEDPLLGVRRIDGQRPVASRLNDSGYTFREIANRIQKYL